MVNWKILRILSIVIGIGGILTVSLIYTLTGGDVPYDYGVVIDAGSSHTQLTTFKWEGDKLMGTGLAWQVTTCRVDGGLAQSTNKLGPEGAAKSLLPCLENITLPIPSEMKSSTPLELGATAGMRLLNISAPNLSLATMIALRCLLEKSGLAVKHVEVLSGDVEGLTAWISVNFLQDIIQDTALEKNTIGALDLGGASTQVSVEVPESQHSVPTTLLKLFGFQHRVLSLSFLCFGVNEAYRRYAANLVEDLNSTEIIASPCLPAGFSINHTAEYLFDQPCTKTYRTALWLFAHPEMKRKNFTFQGISDGNNCSIAVSHLLINETCRKDYSLCFDPPDANISAGTFMAFSSYFYTASFLNSTNSTMENFENATEEFCHKNYSEVIKIPTLYPEFVTKFCFQANFILGILQGYGFNDTTWNRIRFVDKVNSTDVSWSLGYMINSTNAYAAESPTGPAISLAVFISLLVLSFSILLMSLVFFKKSRESSPEIVYETI